MSEVLFILQILLVKLNNIHLKLRLHTNDTKRNACTRKKKRKIKENHN